jgi:hypothetical protein
VEEDEWEDEAEKKEKEETKGHFSLYDLLEVKKDATPDEIVNICSFRKSSTASSCCSTTPIRIRRTQLDRSSRS